MGEHDDYDGALGSDDAEEFLWMKAFKATLKIKVRSLLRGTTEMMTTSQMRSSCWWSGVVQMMFLVVDRRLPATQWQSHFFR